MKKIIASKKNTNLDSGEAERLLQLKKAENSFIVRKTMRMHETLNKYLGPEE